MKKNLLLINILFAMFCFSCSSHSPQIYALNSPKMDIRNYFRGNLEAFGILQDRSGKVIKTFTVKMKGSWQGNDGKLEEDFVFSDGKTDHRVWELKVADDHNFIGKAGDVVGEARGEQYGNAMRMNYVLTIPVDNRKINVKINDWMYLIDNDSLVNVSELKKFGFRVATLTIGFKKIGI
ncbi:MAG: DUF3833 domain-containing protein [Proteobacteria bacterium]|nr:DUF3833 domain-containing protein [Pseudomonadota bacterium]NCA28498.1 DUF3833 domain-containing protein [Pseudomonadota bacterium]